MLTVYSASAGSGKTYNLVLDYLAACFKPHLASFAQKKSRYVCPVCPEYRRILAITFTNNAASEMKERVVKQLNKFAFAKNVEDLDRNDFGNLCRKIFGENHGFSEEECFLFVRNTSKSLLHSILYDYAQFCVTTIDSFIQRIIRSSALYFNLSMNYAVQIRLSDFFRMAIEQYICELPKNQDQLNVVVKELLQQLEEKGNANIQQFLSKGLSILYYDTEKSHPHLKNAADTATLEKIAEQWKRKQKEVLCKCQKEVKPLADKGILILKEAENEGFKANQNSKWDQWFANIATDPFHSEKGFDKSKIHLEMNVDRVLTDAKKSGKSEKESRKALKETYACRLRDVFDQLKEVVLKNAKTYFSCRVLAKNANYLLVLSALQNLVENIKTQTNSFFLSESNPLLSDEIDAGGGEFLFEKMDKYRDIFIDEFQDTSMMQWYDLKPLIINALGNNGNLTLFGDVKQSIYRFRNGEVELFYQLSDYSRMQHRSSDMDLVNMVGGESNYRFNKLDTNYRSQSAVIEFNNLFFRHYAESLGREDYYKDVEQKTRPDETGGLVQVFGYDKSKNRKDIRKVWPDCKEDFYQGAYQDLPYDAAEMLYAVMDARHRGYAYQDMTILLSGRSKCNEFAQHLMLAGVPVVTSESLQLCDNPNINVVISTLRLLINFNDILSQTVILRYFAHQKSKNFNAILCEMKGAENFSELLKVHFGKKDFGLILNQWRRDPFIMSLQGIIRFYDFPRNSDPFVADFLDLAYEYAKTQIASVSNFLTWWDDMNRYNETIPRLSLSAASNAVQLMTIHTSKGLEFPVVITLCTSSKRNDTHYWVKDNASGQSCYVRHEKEMKYSDFQEDYDLEEKKRKLDSLNLWYVDFTRARDMLYILSDFSKKQDPEKESEEKEEVNKDVKTFLMDFTTQLPKENDISYHGNFSWVKKGQDKKKTGTGTSIEVVHSELTFCGNNLLKTAQTEIVSESQSIGTHIHDFLQKLTLFPMTMEERLKEVEGEPEEIRERLLRLFELTAFDEQWRPYFYLNKGDHVLNEVSIITENGETRRPDRIVFKPDHLMVIDYKTGREHKPEYDKQLENYKKYLEKMGYQNVRTKILFID